MLVAQYAEKNVRNRAAMDAFQIFVFAIVFALVLYAWRVRHRQSGKGGVSLLLMGLACAFVDWFFAKAICEQSTVDILLLRNSSCNPLLMAFAYWVIALGLIRLLTNRREE
jgi:ABC-type Co2+ transport system permease subunit